MKEGFDLEEGIALMLGSAFQGVISNIVESAFDAGTDITIDYVSGELAKVFPEISNPDSFLGQFFQNVKMNASAQMQAKIMSSSMRVQNKIDNALDKQIENYKTNFTDYREQVSLGINPDKSFLSNVFSLNLDDVLNKARVRKINSKKREYDGKIAALYRDRHNKRNSLNVSNTQTKTFSNSFSDFSKDERDNYKHSNSNNSKLNQNLVAILNGMGYFVDDEGTIQID